MRLSEIQEQFKNIIIAPETLASGSAGRQFFAAGGICLENRMKVYRNNVIRSLSEVIISTFPMTEKLLGTDFLKQAAREFVAHNLPAEGHLNNYGRGFPDFLADHKVVDGLLYVPDLARLEWAWEECTYAADDRPLNPEALQSLPEEDLAALALRLRASVRILESSYPLDQIVDYCRAEGLESNNAPLTMRDGGTQLMVFRPGLQVVLRKLTAAEFAFIAAIQQDKSLKEVAETVLQDYPDADFSMLLGKFFQIGVFSDYIGKGSTGVKRKL